MVLRCLEESGITAFFTRSSAANIPVNLNLARKLGISEELYSVTIPVGATVNMAGAAITITVLTLAAANTLGLEVSLGTALVLCVIAALSACGASGVPSVSLLLVPLACSLFGISLDLAMQVVSRFMNRALKRRGQRATVVGATSGDTGAAAIEAFRGLDAIDGRRHRRVAQTPPRHCVRL